EGEEFLGFAEDGALRSFLDAGFLLLRQRLEPGRALDKCQFHRSGWAVALLGDDEFGQAVEVGIVRTVNLFAKDKRHEICILFDRTRFPQIRQLWAMIAATALRGTA